MFNVHNKCWGSICKLIAPLLRLNLEEGVIKYIALSKKESAIKL